MLRTIRFALVMFCLLGTATTFTSCMSPVDIVQHEDDEDEGEDKGYTNNN